MLTDIHDYFLPANRSSGKCERNNPCDLKVNPGGFAGLVQNSRLHPARVGGSPRRTSQWLATGKGALVGRVQEVARPFSNTFLASLDICRMITQGLGVKDCGS